MKISEILGYLEDEGLSEIEELTGTDEYSIVKFFYDFDNDEIEAAKSFANEECDDEAQSDEWYREWYNPYLMDIANDNVESSFEDIMDDFEVSAFFKVLEGDIGDTNFVKYIAVISESEELELEDILSEYSE